MEPLLNYRGLGAFPFIPSRKSVALASMGYPGDDSQNFFPIKMTIQQACRWIWLAKMARLTWNLTPGGAGTQDIYCAVWAYGHGFANTLLTPPLPNALSQLHPYQRVRTANNYAGGFNAYQGVIQEPGSYPGFAPSAPIFGLSFIPGLGNGYQPSGNYGTGIVYDDLLPGSGSVNPSYDPTDPQYVLARFEIFGGYPDTGDGALSVSSAGVYAIESGYPNTAGTNIVFTLSDATSGTSVSSGTSTAQFYSTFLPHDTTGGADPPGPEPVTGTIDLAMTEAYAPGT